MKVRKDEGVKGGRSERGKEWFTKNVVFQCVDEFLGMAMDTTLVAIVVVFVIASATPVFLIALISLR